MKLDSKCHVFYLIQFAIISKSIEFCGQI